MDIIPLISSVSKIAIGAFIITLIVVGYEVFLLMRRRSEHEEQHEENIELPEYSNTVKEGTFSPVDVVPVNMQPAEVQSRRISKPFLIVLLGLLVFIVLGLGYLIYRRNQIASVKVDEVSPVGGSGVESSPVPTRKVADALPTSVLFPTVQLEPTEAAVTDAPDSTGTVVSGTPAAGTPTPSTSGTTVTGTVTSSVTTAATITEAPLTQTLPQAGSYQTTLMISLVAIVIIYLAFIL